MTGTLTTVLGDPEDLQAALGSDGVVRLVVTARGPFRARLTRVTLHDLYLMAAEEELPRIAFVSVPPGTVVIGLPVGDGPRPIWSGSEMGADEIVILGAGERLHTRTTGACCWGTIRLPAQELVKYGQALLGADFAAPDSAVHWRPARATLRALRQLHRAATRLTGTRSTALADPETAHGLEQQLIHALVECLPPAGRREQIPAARRRCNDLLGQYEGLLQATPIPDIHSIEMALGASRRTLSGCCAVHLGVTPSRYRRLCGLQRVHQMLRGQAPLSARVTELARLCGFDDGARFAADYRGLYAESPAAVRRRKLHLETRD